MAMAMAATNQSTRPSCFNFLKEGLLLPTRNRLLFTELCAIVVASTTLLLLANELAVRPLADEIQLDAKALSGIDPSSLDYARLVQEIQDDARELLLVGAGYLLIAVIVGSAVRIVLLFAAVLTYSGEQQRTASFGALLGKAKAGLKGPLLTLAFVYVLEVVYVVLLAFMGAIFGVLMVKQYHVAFVLASLLFLAAAVCFIYFSFVCSFSVVVAVAEPGCHGAAALGKAWRLAKGKRRQVVLYVAVTSALAGVLSPVHTLARTCPGNSVALGLLLGFLYAVLMALVQLFDVCAMTAFYYERRDNSSDVGQTGATTGYAKLSTEEASAA